MKALVTGGGGFLGRAIVDRLIARGDSVRSFSRGAYPELAELGVECGRGDLRDPGAVYAACEGMDAVFHVAALAGAWGPYETFFGINVMGTQNVIRGCLEKRVPKLVYTSSPSVVFGDDELLHADESVPYPDRYLAHYPATKALAERSVLAANARDGLATCALRPHLIYGPRDTHIVPMLIEKARGGTLRRIGEGTNLVDVTYVDNGAVAHLQAADALASPEVAPAGQAYFISDGEPVNLWRFVDNLLAGLGEPPVGRGLPLAVAEPLAAALEAVHGLSPRLGEPRLTRFLARNFALSHYFDLTRARADFGYTPAMGQAEGLARTIAWFRAHRQAEGA